MSDLERLESIEERLAKIARFFECRDEMNSWIHLEPPRRSPITESARECRDDLMRLIMDMRQR